ncbi:MAG: Wzz/FepE/Etk N-terminal domain-containing protein [Flavobacteriales bacterium]|nr:Wzz/FepE/Etk N-terminal domain-containing protein [Flavobacteriales bacterium]
MKNNDDASFKGIIVTISDYKNELKKRLLIILAVAIIFSLIGFGFSKLQEDRYNAVISFIVEDQSGGPNLSALSGMANMIGIDMGGSATSSFNQQNIIELLKSRKIIERTLNNTCKIEGKSDLLINHYIRINNLITDSSTINLSSHYYNDSITRIVWFRIIDGDMDILYQNDEANILNLSFESLNAELAKNFTEIVIDEMSEMYIDHQTEKSRNTLNNLYNRSDSIFNDLKISERNFAKVKDNNMRVMTASGRLEELQYMREVEILQSVYLELRKNIELSHMSVLNETPLIQIVDKPVLPLENINRSNLFWIVIFTFLGVFTICFIIILRKLVRNALEEDF